VSFYVSTATFFLLHCDEWDRVVALPRHKFVTGATLLQLGKVAVISYFFVEFFLTFAFSYLFQLNLRMVINCLAVVVFSHRFAFLLVPKTHANTFLYLTTMYVCCVYPAISKSLKQLSNCLKIAVTRVVLSVFKGVICDVSAYTVTVLIK
jgi:hypothetical protein